MTLTSKFKKDLQTLKGAAAGDFFLDVKNPKLYKKVRRYYENEGVELSGDPLDDYEILMDCVVSELESVGANAKAVYSRSYCFSNNWVG